MLTKILEVYICYREHIRLLTKSLLESASIVNQVGGGKELLGQESPYFFANLCFFNCQFALLASLLMLSPLPQKLFRRSYKWLSEHWTDLYILLSAWESSLLGHFYISYNAMTWLPTWILDCTQTFVRQHWSIQLLRSPSSLMVSKKSFGLIKYKVDKHS